MPEATLKYNLPEEQSEFNIACAALNMYNSIHAMTECLRSKIKYDPDSMTTTELKTYEKIREELYTILDSNGVHMDELE